MMESMKQILTKYAPKEFLEDEDAYDYIVSMLVDDKERIVQESKEDDEYIVSLLDGFISSYNNIENEEYYQENLKKMSALILIEMSSLCATKEYNEQEKENKGKQVKLMTLNETVATVVSSSSEEETIKKKPRKKEKISRKQRRKEKNKSSQDNPQKLKTISSEEAKKLQEKSLKELESLDDYGSAWAECQVQNKQWGGRGYGGRGIRQQSTTSGNIHLSNVTMQFAGNELLTSTNIQISQPNKYGLIGRNGVGKSTLLRRLFHKSIPGFPMHVRVNYVQQQVDGDDRTAIQTLLETNSSKKELEQERDALEQQMDELVKSSMSGEKPQELTDISNLLSEVLSELDALGDDFAQKERAVGILKGLQFSKEYMTQETKSLSGGWKMRLALAQALYNTPCDLLLLDEPTNHLDLHAVTWLAQYLSKEKKDLTMIIVSHDKSFLDQVCTHIIAMEHQRLTYHQGNYSSYISTLEEKAAQKAQILDASERQRAKAQKFIDKQQSMQHKKNADPNKLKQAKMMKDKKLDRIGNYREDGKRYKNFSLAKMDEDALLLSQKVVIEADDPILKFKFPNPPKINSTLIQMEHCSFSYADKSRIVDNVTLSVEPESKIAIVGKNGAGKSTLLKLLTKEVTPTKGTITQQPKLRIGEISQHHIEALDAYAKYTVVEYMEYFLQKSQLSELTKTHTALRSHLGAFGLGASKYTNRALGGLSGGEKMRLCFATVMTSNPHLLVLDEPTNHLDMETLDALANALDKFQGSILIVSHNRSFLTGFCNELWVVQDAKVDIMHSDAYHSFDEHFSCFAIGERAISRTNKADLAKRAAAQRQNTIQRGGFIA